MSTPNASGWKPGTPVEGHNAMSGPDTATGNRALMLGEPLLFEIGHVETTGVDLPEPGSGANRLGGFERSEAIGLPGLSEPETGAMILADQVHRCRRGGRMHDTVDPRRGY